MIGIYLLLNLVKRAQLHDGQIFEQKHLLQRGAILCALGCMLVFASCNDKAATRIEQQANTCYYVKYSVDVSTQQIGNGTHITVNTEKGEQTFNASREFSETFGPVSQNFEAKISTYTTYTVTATVTIHIYVSRGEEPFVLKGTKTMTNPSKQNPAIVEYSIDF